MDSSMMLAALHGDSAVYAHVANAESLEEFDTTTMSSLTDDILAVITTTTTSATTTTASPDSNISMNNFYPALVQCFGIIICG